MKYLLIVIASMVATSFAQESPKQPQLSTSDQIAIRTLEKTKQDAQKQYQDAGSAEASIMREFQQSHPGYHVNPSNFSVEKDTDPEVKSEKK